MTDHALNVLDSFERFFANHKASCGIAPLDTDMTALDAFTAEICLSCPTSISVPLAREAIRRHASRSTTHWPTSGSTLAIFTAWSAAHDSNIDCAPTHAENNRAPFRQRRGSTFEVSASA